MEILMIISLIISVIPVFILIDMADHDKIKKTTAILAFGCWTIGVCVFAYLTTIETQQDMLDQPNPYKKEYTYKQLPSGEYVKTDSSYVKCKTKK